MPDLHDEWRGAEHAARAALAAHPATASLAAAAFEPIAGSLSNFAWHARTHGADRFVRLAGAGTEQLGADLEAEATVLDLAAAAGIAPPVVHCDPAARLLVTHWIDAVAITPDGTDGETVVTAVAQALQSLHALAAPATLRRVSFAQQAERLQEALPRATRRSSLMQLASDVLARLESGHAPLATCHHDVHAQNMLFDRSGRLWLVDWEYAGLGDPVFDLASFASQHGLEAPATAQLVRAYIQAGGAVEGERMELARWAFDYVQWLWYRGLQRAGAAQAEAGQRASRLELDLAGRASSVLRCNNRGFEHNDGRV